MALEYLNSINLNTIVSPDSTSQVFKDDCMFSFDTAFDPQGLDICMTCHQAFSRGEINYTQVHSEFFDHKVFLNYKKIKKQVKIEEKPIKMMKLEIKEESESDLFDTTTSIYVSSIDATVEYPNPKLPIKITDTADKIVKSTSNERKQEIKSWEQEIKPCHHATSIVQTPIPNLNLHKCSSCELTENLWICIHCGSIGCGRAQFGGVPGNSHAVKHHDVCPNHHIAVKLGSLSMDSADCYCYTCDDEVKIPDLARVLKTFGIDISNFVKTEKNLTELQLEQNIKWDFKMDGKNGEFLQPVLGAGLTGFKNLGNSCYLASVLQVLYSTKTFEDAFYSLEGMPIEKILGNFKPYEDLETQMFKLGDGLLSGRYSIADDSTTDKVKYQRGIKPSGFKNLIGEGHPEFSTMLQQDAFEFWGYLLDKIEKQEITGQLDYNPVDDFRHIIQTKFKCMNCKGVRITKELSDNICIPIKNIISSTNEDGSKNYEVATIEEGLSTWNNIEHIEYQCSKCNSKQTAIRTQGFKTFPNYLVLNPQRITLENWVPVKLSVPIKFNESLSLSDFKCDEKFSGEEELPDDDEAEDKSGKSKEFKFNQEAIESLMVMGFPENRCKRALYKTGNTNAETAMNWLFEHMDDPNIDSTFIIPENDDDNIKNAVNSESIDMLVSMGFTEKLSTKALTLNNGNVEQSVEWLFSNADDDGELPKENNKAEPVNDKMERFENDEKATTISDYELLGIICHKGTSVHSGHYVAFIKKNINGEDKWVLFNDEKVVLSIEDNLKEEVETSGYLYIYEKNYK